MWIPDRESIPASQRHHPLYDRQPDTGSGKFIAGNQTSEGAKHVILVLRRDADAVVRHLEAPWLTEPVDRDHHLRWHPFACERDPVGDEVLED